MELKGFNDSALTEKNEEAQRSETWHRARERMQKRKDVKHFTAENKADNVYGWTWDQIVKEYLRSGYHAAENNPDVVVMGETYKTLKRPGVTVFYDAAGDTLFDVTNERLEKEYEWLMNNGAEAEPEPEQEEGTEKAAECIKGKSESGFCGAAAHCDKDLECCDVCDDPCNSRCGWLDRNEKSVEVNNDAVEKVCAVSAERENGTEDGEVSGQKERSEKSAAVYAGVSEAEAKLKSELEKTKEKDFAEPIIGYLIDRCKESESLAADICQKHKTWEKCYNYIFEQARKKLSGRSGPVRNDVVYEWAEDYYHLDDKALEEKKAKEGAEHKKKAVGKKKRVSEKKPDETAKRSTNKAVTIPKEKKAVTQKPQRETPKPKKNELEGQMDIFSLMGM